MDIIKITKQLNNFILKLIFLYENNMNIIYIGKDIIHEILRKFDDTNYDDVQFLCRLSQTCHKMYHLIKPIILHLISFFKYKHKFKMFGHYESIKTRNWKIINYMISKFSCYNAKFCDYITYNEFKFLMSGKKIYILNELIKYHTLNENKKKCILKWINAKLIEHGDYECFINSDKNEFRHVAYLSNNEDIINYMFNKYPFETYYLHTAVEFNKYKSLRYYLSHVDPKIIKNQFQHMLELITSSSMFWLLYEIYTNDINEILLDNKSILITIFELEIFDVFDFIVNKYMEASIDLQFLMDYVDSFTITIPKIKKLVDIFKIDENILLRKIFNSNNYISCNFNTIKYIFNKYDDLLYPEKRLKFLLNSYPIHKYKEIDFYLSKDSSLMKKINLDKYDTTEYIKLLNILYKYDDNILHIINKLKEKYKKNGYLDYEYY